MAHKLKIILKYTDPQVPRTVIVPENFTFHKVMNWENSILYQFNLWELQASDLVKPIIEELGFGGFFYGISKVVENSTIENAIARKINSQNRSTLLNHSKIIDLKDLQKKLE